MGRLVHKVLDGIRIAGFSLAGEETVVAVPEYDVCFDVGRAPREIIAINNLCLTHGHMDHAAGIAYYLSQRHFIGNAPGRVIVHRSLAQPLQRLMDVWSDIEGHHTPFDIVGVDALEEVELRRGLAVRPFAVNHASGALGFSLIEKRHKLKPEYHGLLGPEIVALKKKGVAIEDFVEIPLVTYTGDTAIGRFLELDFVRASRVAIVECTFFDPEHRTRAQAGRHIHVDDLPRVLEAIPDAQIAMMHLSRRTDMRLAKKILKEMIGASDLERITFLMDRPSRREAREANDTRDRGDAGMPLEPRPEAS